MSEFCHLHCHTQYSLLDGAARIDKLIGRAAELEHPAVAITDHGNLYGVPEFYTKARRAGVQPVIGCEFYVTASGMADKKDRVRYHQVLLAKTLEGYKNLIRLSSLSYTDGYYYKPRIDRDTLRKYSEGLVATTCCLQGEVLQTILKKGEEDARAVFEDYLDIFGEDYYIEVQDHAIPDQRTCNAVLMRWADEYGVKAIASNDVHYVHQLDAEAQDVLLCLQTGADLHDPNRMRFENDQFYLKTADEMRLAFGSSVREGVFKNEAAVDAALAASLEVADKCRLELPMGKLLMPHFPIPAQFNDDAGAYLRHLTYEGAKTRWPEISEVIRERLDLELGVIGSMGFDGYFLITQDFTTAARKLGVSVGPGRGSAAGSAVAYCLGITNIDPLEYDLLFERFLNPERVSMPDIDIDFDDRGRGKVIDYVVEKYGRESVCQIVTFGTMGSKSVIRDVSRVLGVPLDEADRIAKLIPDGVKVSLEDAKGQVKEFSDLYSHQDGTIRKLMHYATVLEGSARHTGVHAAGVIIAPGDVSQYVPVSVQRGKGGASDAVVTQYDGKYIEDFGLLKMDFLGLKTLTILDDALALIKQTQGVEIDLDALPLDDEDTYKLFQKGDTISVFQFESSGMREWMRKLKPTSIDDLIAMNALYRPGPMDLIPSYIDRKHGKEVVEYPHPMLEGILAPTYGIPVYQEQVMQMAQVMGGYTLGGADLLRRAMGKKKQSEMDKQRDIFVEGAGEKGVPEGKANEVFDMMAKFAGYGFNKSHSAAYSVVAYHTAYLKAHYPAEFMAAVLTTEMAASDKLAIALESTRATGIEILAPCVNRSDAYFTVEHNKIRFGLGAIKGVGLGAIENIVACREKAGGAFDDLFALARDLDLRTVGKKTLEALAQAGALDAFDGHRRQFSDGVDLAWSYAQKYQADKAAGQSSLFGAADTVGSSFVPALPHCEPWTKGETLRKERDLMGFYVSGHPLDDFAAEARTFGSVQLGNAEHVPHESDQTAIGIVTEVTRRTTKSGRPIAFVTVEDTTGAAEVVLFAQVLERCGHLIEVDSVMMVKGKAETSRGDLKLIAKDILPMWRVREQLVKAITLRVDADSHTEQEIESVASLCREHPGACKVYFEIVSQRFPRPVRLHARTAVVDLTPELMKGLDRVLGQGRVVLESEA